MGASIVDRSRAVIGMLLVLGGLVFLLDAADVLPARRLLSDWWPLLLVAIGLVVMFRRPRSLTGGGILIAVGAVLLLATLDIIDIALWQLIIPVILIGAGLSLVIRGLGGGRASDRRNRFNLLAVLSEQLVRSEATRFRAASLTSVLGEVKLDLRNATLDPSGAQVDIFCMLGDASVFVPRGWRVHISGVPILGEFEDETDHEAALPADAPEITITGVSFLADVDVKHG